jgi:glucosamine-phosphate N-acetyltransferase
MKDYIIRKLNNSDYEQYKILINEFRETEFDENIFKEIYGLINKNSDIWILEKNNEIIGTGTILYEYKYIRNICKLAHIEDICILKKYRNNGFGTILIDYLINESKKENCYKITLYCEDKLENFYMKSGLEKKGIQMAIYL